jgi:uncharacterized protein (TIGR02145 family)
MKKSIQNTLKYSTLLLVGGILLSACNEHSLPATWDEGREFSYGTMKDASGNVYNTVTVDETEWMAENLAQNIKDDANVACRSAVSDTECERGGAYYSHQLAQSICPTGWRLPSDADWHKLISVAGKRKNKNCLTQKDAVFATTDKAKRFPKDLELGTCMAEAGEVLKSTTAWKAGFNGTDLLHIGMAPEGYKDISNEFLQVDEYAYYWSSDIIANPVFGSEKEAASSWYVTKSSEVVHEENYTELWMSVRCVKDSEGNK